MADAGEINVGNALVGGGPKLAITAKPELLHHLVSDEELEKLSTMSRNWILEAIWACVGVVVGTVKGTASALMEAYGTENVVPLSVGDVVEIVMFFAAILVATALFFANRSGVSDAKDLIAEIRSREKIPNSD